MYCTPGSISSSRMYMVKLTEISPRIAETMMYRIPMSLWLVDMNQRVKNPLVSSWA